MTDRSRASTEIPPLDPLYINERRVATFVGADVLASALRGVEGFNPKRTAILSSIRCAELLHDWLERVHDEVDSLHMQIARGDLVPGRLFIYEGYLVCRNVRGRRKAVGPLAYAKLPGVSPGDVRLELAIHPDHVVAGSPGDLMSGTVSSLFVLAQVTEVRDGLVRAVPAFVGYLRKQGVLEFARSVDRNEVFVDEIDNFAACKSLDAPSTSVMGVLKGIPEVDIKTAFAEIIGEPLVPKDWGGERSDLFSTYVRMGERRVSTAFAFKGPAGGGKFREMRPSDLGANGDQVERLANEPADLLVVQHCHAIGSAVRNTVRAFCNQLGRERKFCLISGYDTYRVLKAYGQCGL